MLTSMALPVLLGPVAAHASCALPHTISNGQVADATKLMDNLQAAADCGAPAGPNNSVQINADGESMGSVGPLTNGQVIVGSTGSAPVAATLTAGTGIAIANGPGSVTITASGAATNWWFQPPTAAQFTLASGDATSLSLTDDTQAGLLVGGGAPVTGDVLRVGYQTLSNKNADWDLKVRITGLIPTTNYSGYGIIIRDSISGRVTSQTVRGGGAFEINNWNGLVGYNGHVTGAVFTPPPVWFRVQHSGSNYVFSTSPDGKRWQSMVSVGDTSWLTNKADQVGIVIDYNRNSGFPNTMAVEYYSLVQ